MLKAIFKEFRETAYYEYLWYVLRHKWYVAVECWKEGLYWQALTHDLSKFLPDEFIPYARHFHGPEAKENKTQATGKAGYKKPVQTSDPVFDRAWLRHTRRNPHHSEYWALAVTDGEPKTFPMPEKYVREMVCDWRGAGKAQNNPTPTSEWYLANLERLLLHPQTENLVEDLLGIFRTVVGTAVNEARGGETVTVLTASSGFSKVEADFKVAEGFSVDKGSVLCLTSDGTVKPLFYKSDFNPNLIVRLVLAAKRKVGIFDHNYTDFLVNYEPTDGKIAVGKIK